MFFFKYFYHRDNSDKLFVPVFKVLSRLSGQQITHQIYLKYQDINV